MHKGLNTALLMTKPVLWFGDSTSAIALLLSISQSQTVHKTFDGQLTGKSIQAKKVPAVIYNDRAKVYCAGKILRAFVVLFTVSNTAVSK